MFAVVFFR